MYKHWKDFNENNISINNDIIISNIVIINSFN